MATIYALIDERSPEIFRYIGKTVKAPTQRLYMHLYRVDIEGHLHKARWIKKTIRSGSRISIVVLEECADIDQAEREIYWIRKCRMGGHPLTNMSDGGEGGVNPHPDVREKIAAAMRGKKRPPHVVEALRKNGLQYVGSANPNFGKKHTDEARAKMSAAKKGRSLTAEHRAKVSAAGKGKNSGKNNGSCRLSEDNVREIYRQKVEERRHIRDIAEKFGIHPMTVYKITSGRKWAHLNLSAERPL